MKDRILMALAFVMTVGPALAGTVDAISLPEPGTMTMFGAAAVGAYLVRKFNRRK